MDVKISPILSNVFNIVVIDDTVVKNRGGDLNNLFLSELITHICDHDKVLIDNNNNLDAYIKDEDLNIIKPRLEHCKNKYNTIIIHTEKDIIIIK